MNYEILKLSPIDMNILFILLFLTLAATLLLAVLFWIGFFYNLIRGDAPFLRSNRKKINIMLELAQIKPGETVIDLGSGDGALLIEAARHGAKSIGVEINLFLAVYSRVKVRLKRLGHKINIVRGNLNSYPLDNADVIFIYLLPETLFKLQNKLSSECKLGARIVTNTFSIPGWTPEKEKNSVYLYKKP